MLTKSDWWVQGSHVPLNLFEEMLGREDAGWVRMLRSSFFSGVRVVELLCSLRSPFFNSNKGIIEDLLTVDLYQATITIISDTTTIETRSNQNLNGLPINFVRLFVITLETRVCNFTHVGGHGILTDRVVGIVKSVANVPTESLELFALNEDGMEPT